MLNVFPQNSAMPNLISAKCRSFSGLSLFPFYRIVKIAGEGYVKRRRWMFLLLLTATRFHIIAQGVAERNPGQNNKNTIF
jgi:hypothetical protein